MKLQDKDITPRFVNDKLESLGQALFDSIHQFEERLKEQEVHIGFSTMIEEEQTYSISISQLEGDDITNCNIYLHFILPKIGHLIKTKLLCFDNCI